MSNIFDDLEYLRKLADREAELERTKLDERVAHIGTVLRMYRENACMSPADLSEASGVSIETIYELEEHLLPFEKLTLELVYALAKPLHLTVFILVSAGQFKISELKRDTDNAAWRCHSSDS